MTDSIKLLILALLIVGTGPAKAAGLNDVVEATQAHLNGHSEREGLKKYLTLTFTENFQGPGVNNLDGHRTTRMPDPAMIQALKQKRASSPRQNTMAPGGTSAATVAGFGLPSGPMVTGASLRHVIAAGYRFNDSFTLGPVFEMSQKLYGPTSGTLIANDPQLRLSINDLVHANVGPHVLRLNLWISADAPLSDQSQAMHTVTALGVSILPHFQIAHSDFSLSGIGGIRPSIIQADNGGGVLFPTPAFAGVQVNYRISRPFTVYAMNYIFGIMGPQVATPDNALTATMRGPGSGRKIGLMPGVLIRVSDFLSISPRLNWSYGQPLDTTTVGVNANIIMI